MACFGESQAGEQRSGSCARAVTVDRFELVVQIGQMFAGNIRVALRRL